MRKICLTVLMILSTAFLSGQPLLSEGFESGIFPPEGWTLITTGGEGFHQSNHIPNSVAHEGSMVAAHMDDNDVCDNFLVTHKISLSDLNKAVLSFWEYTWYRQYVSAGYHQVCVSTDMVNWNVLYQGYPESDGIWEGKMISLHEYSGLEVYVGFRYVGNYEDRWYIDDISVFYDDIAPKITKVEGNPALLPVIGAYSGNDMNITVTVEDMSVVEYLKGFYAFGAEELAEIVFAETSEEGIWHAAIPARYGEISGTIYFESSDISGNAGTTECYAIHFVNDTDPPVITGLLNTLAFVGSDLDIVLRIEDESQIGLCKGYYSRDNFMTVYEFSLVPVKINEYHYTGTIPAEQEIVDNGYVYFTVKDSSENELISDKYSVSWVEAMPYSFDLRNYNSNNYVTSVKSQQGGTCWAHAVMASMESNLLMTGVWSDNGESGEPNLAEYHLDWWNGFNEHYNEDIVPDTGEGLEVHMGGDYLVTAAYTSRGEGTVRNSDGQIYDYPPRRYDESYHIYYPRIIEWYSIYDQLGDIEIIKYNVMNKGAVGTCMMYASQFINSEYEHYQPPSDTQEPNHAVTIIGWDDNRVTQAPEGSGAWLVKNSWGTAWGNSGYFWISYYDKHAARNREMGAISFQDVEMIKYDNIYYHDYHGWRDTMTDCSEAFNAFKAEKDEWLTAVSFYTAEDNANYVVRIFESFDGLELSGLLSEITGYRRHRGFFTADLSGEVFLEQGKDFYVYLELSHGGQPYDRTSEIPVLLGSKSKALVRSTASAGESYYMSSGGWTDLQNYTGDDYPGTSNFCIKALSNDNSGIGQNDIQPDSFELYQNYPNPFNPETVITYAIERDAFVDLSVYNLKGEKVSVLANDNIGAGIHNVNFNAQTLTSGVYYYSLKINGKTEAVRKMLLVR